MKRPAFFDIHSHLNDVPFDEDRKEAVVRLQDRDTWTITVGVDEKTSQKACEMTLLWGGLFATVGQHPTDNVKENFSEEFYKDLVKKSSKVVAIGECSLSRGMFIHSYNCPLPLDKIIPVDVYIPGCPPKPEAIISGVVKALSAI